MADLSIGRTAAKTGVKVPTIRYYEEVGLMPPAPRNQGNQRVYDEQAIKRLRFIAHARQLGFSLEQIGQLLHLSDDPGQSCVQANQIAQQHLREIESRMKRLRSLKKELLNMVDVCQSNGTIADCRVIETLADHGKCLSREH